MDLLQMCVVKSLEKCEESTPANLVESMFKFVRNETPCVNITSVSYILLFGILIARRKNNFILFFRLKNNIHILFISDQSKASKTKHQ